MSATTKTKKSETTETKAKPVAHIQVGGVRIPIWANATKDGSQQVAGQPELSYKGSDGQWHVSKSYGTRDLVNLMKAAALAHTQLVQANLPAKSDGAGLGDYEPI